MTKVSACRLGGAPARIRENGNPDALDILYRNVQLGGLAATRGARVFGKARNCARQQEEWPPRLIIVGPSAMDAHLPPNIQVWPPLWSYATARGGGMRAVARQATKGLLFRLRPYSRPAPVPHLGGRARRVAPRQRQNQPKRNAIKYAAARLCLLSHHHRVYPSDFALLGERLREASGARPLHLADGAELTVL
jgi:hypothetical protein